MPKGGQVWAFLLLVSALQLLYLLLINFHLALFYPSEDSTVLVPNSSSSSSSSSRSKTQKHVRTLQKQKLGQRSYRTTPNTLNVSTPLPDSQEVHSSSSSRSSALVSLAALPQQERQFISGVYQYSDDDHNDDVNGAKSSALIIRGASITSDYHSPGKRLWFQLFAFGNRIMDKKLAPGGHYCSLDINNNNNNNNNVQNSNNTILPLTPWNDMHEEIFLCNIGTKTSRAILMPSKGVDSNTNEVVQIWRCPIKLSSSDFEKFYHHPTADMAMAITFLHKKGNNNKNNNDKRDTSSLTTTTTEVTTIYIPSIEPSVGVGRVESSSPQPFFKQRHDITLCVVAHPNGLVNLNEFITYHRTVVGIDHFHISFYLQSGNVLHNADGIEDDALLPMANSLLAHDIDEGRVSLSTLWNANLTGGISCSDQAVPKNFFYQECLYRAKSTSEFVATWDLDEFFLFQRGEKEKKKKEEARREQKYHLPDFLRGIKHTKCQDWSFVTMKSSFAGGISPEHGNYQTGLKAIDYPRRTLATNTVWQKSISKTKNVFLNTFHLPGSCIPQGTANHRAVSEAASAIHPSDDKCAFYVEGAQMVHTKKGAGGDGKGTPIHKQSTVRNEMQSLLTGEVYYEDRHTVETPKPKETVARKEGDHDETETDIKKSSSKNRYQLSTNTRWATSGQGGICTCPDGLQYVVADQYDFCQSLQCDGGVSTFKCTKKGSFYQYAAEHHKIGWGVVCASASSTSSLSLSSSDTEADATVEPTKDDTIVTTKIRRQEQMDQ